MPTAWWPADEDANDVIGTHHGQLRNGASIKTPAVRGKAFRLNAGTTGKRYVEVPHDAGLDFGAGDFTLSLWVRFTALEGEMVLAEKWSWGSAPTTGWTLTRLPSDQLRFATGPEIDPNVDTSPIGFKKNTWYHVAVTRAAGVTTIYVNGLPRACGTLGPDVDNTTPLSFGHRGPGNPGFYMVRGSIDEVQLWVGTALDAESVANLWAYTLAGANLCSP
jgi:sialidase-1